MNTSFSRTTPNLQLAWDSSSLTPLKDCARKYQYSIVQGIVPRARSFHLDFGLRYTEAMERYDRYRMAGHSHDAALHATVHLALKDTWDKELNRPWSSGDSYKNRFTLIRTIIWHAEQFQDDPLETLRLRDDKPAVELSFRFDPQVSMNGEPIQICGHLDRVATISGQTWVVDHKTTKHDITGSYSDRYFAQYTPHNQMSLYSFASKIIYDIPVAGVIIDAAQVLVSGSRFKRGIAHRTESYLNEWWKDTLHHIELATEYALDNYWPMNDSSCDKYGGCPYREICSRSPEVREKFLNDPTRFTKRIWDPILARGEE